MVGFEEAINNDVKRFKQRGGTVSYPFPIEEFAVKVFGLDIQYENFDLIINKDKYEPGDFFGMLFPEKDPISGFERVIYINTNRKPFKLGDYEVPAKFYIENADRQTIARSCGIAIENA